LPNKINDLRDYTVSKSYPIVHKINTFHHHQVKRLLKLYTNFSYDSSHNKDDLYLIFKNKFEAVFKLMSAVDIYGFTKKILYVFKINKLNTVVPHKKCIDLLTKINTTAEHFITVEMNKLINQPGYEQIVLDMDWPNFTIIKKCFYEYNVANAANVNLGNIIDIYNIDNKITYSLSTIDKFPPAITSKMIEQKTHMGAKRKKYEKNKQKGLKIVNYISRNQISYL
jgi:hypothetical protein